MQILVKKFFVVQIMLFLLCCQDYDLISKKCFSVGSFNYGMNVARATLGKQREFTNQARASIGPWVICRPKQSWSKLGVEKNSNLRMMNINLTMKEMLKY